MLSPKQKINFVWKTFFAIFSGKGSERKMKNENGKTLIITFCQLYMPWHGSGDFLLYSCRYVHKYIAYKMLV